MTSILFETSSTHIGGAERFLLRLAQGIRKRHPDWKLGCIVLGQHGPLHDEYRQTFSELVDGPTFRSEVAGKIAQLAVYGEYDICHCVDLFSGCSDAAKIATPCRFVANVFPSPGSQFAPDFEHMPDYGYDNGYAAIVTEVKANLAVLPQPGRKPQILTNIPNGIDTDFWTPGECERDIDVVWCGHAGRNGHNKALEVIATLCNVGLRCCIVTIEPSTHIRMDIGPGSLRELAIHAALCPAALRDIFRHSKIFLSTSEAEGMPSTPMESASCGCYPFMPNIDGMAEVFGDFPAFLQWLDYGPCNEPQKPDVIVEQLRDIIGFETWSPSGEERAREIARRYSLDAMIGKYLDLYDNLLTTPR